MFFSLVLIETLWNVNVCFITQLSSAVTVLIETLWNVNSLTVFVSVIAFIVLIETLWNVNVTASTVERCCRTVLIETLWNVNELSPFKKLNADNGINRNIVECKYFIASFLHSSQKCINRNIVECKQILISSSLAPTVVLIETLWNVNYSSSCSQTLRTYRINRNIVECKFVFHRLELFTDFLY